MDGLADEHYNAISVRISCEELARLRADSAALVEFKKSFPPGVNGDIARLMVCDRAIAERDGCTCDSALYDQMKREGNLDVWSWHNARCRRHRIGYAESQLVHARADSARLDKLASLARCWEGGVMLHFFNYGSDLRAAIDAAPEPEPKP